MDAEAKRAAHHETSPSAELPLWITKGPLPASLSKVRQALNDTFKKAVIAKWKESPRAMRTVRIDLNLPSKKFLLLIEPLPRQQASLLIQLLTGHVPLNQHLHRITKADTDRCPKCKQARETVAHFVLDCPEYEEARVCRFFKLGPPASSLQYLLTDPKAMKPLFCFIHDTRRFTVTYDC